MPHQNGYTSSILVKLSLAMESAKEAAWHNSARPSFLPLHVARRLPQSSSAPPPKDPSGAPDASSSSGNYPCRSALASLTGAGLQVSACCLNRQAHQRCNAGWTARTGAEVMHCLGRAQVPDQAPAGNTA